MNLPPSIWGFAAISIASLIVQIKGSERLTSFLHWLFFVNTGLFMMSGANEAGRILIAYLIVFSAILFLLSVLTAERFKSVFLRLFFPSIFVAALVLLHHNTQLTYFKEAHTFGNKFLFTGITLVLFGTELSRWKLNMFSRITGALDSSLMLTVFQLFVLAVAIFMASFGSGSLGVFAVAFVFLSTSFFRKDSDSFLLLIPLLFSIIPGVIHFAGIESEIYFQADVIAALIMGAFLTGFAQCIRFDKGKPVLSLLLILLMVISLSAGMTMLGGQFELLGGADALIAMLVGIVLTGGVFGKGLTPLNIIGLTLVTGLLSIPRQELDIQKDHTEKGLITEKYISVDNLLGSFEYLIIPDSSKIDFRIGPKLQTKGAIKSLKGKFIFREASQLRVDLEIGIDDLTTFNRMRDEELMGPLYFNAAVYPSMKFKSTAFKKLNETEYELIGDFTMLGKTNRETLSLQRLESDRLIFKGKGSLDRTKYGMEPNSSEGNIVEYTYVIVLEKKN